MHIKRSTFTNFSKKLFIEETLMHIYCFFLILGTKINNIDMTSVVAILFFVFILRERLQHLKYHKIINILLVLLGILTLHSFLSVMLNHSLDYQLFFRYIRCTINVISITFVVYNCRLSPICILKIVRNILLIQAVCIILGAINLEIAQVLTRYSNFNKELRLFRNSGLLAGFDIAGLLMCLGFCINLVYRILIKKKQMVGFIVFITSILFTSRFSMLLLAAIMFLSLLILWKHKCYAEFTILLVPLCTLVILATILVSTTVTGLSEEHVLGVESYILMKLEVWINKFSVSDIYSIINQHFDFSKLSHLWFGDGILIDADPGYTITIYSIGLIGCLESISYFLIVYLKARPNKAMYDNSSNLLCFSIFIWFIIVIFFDLKNNYFFTRNITELGMILWILLLRMRREQQNELKIHC